MRLTQFEQARGMKGRGVLLKPSKQRRGGGERYLLFENDFDKGGKAGWARPEWARLISTAVAISSTEVASKPLAMMASWATARMRSRVGVRAGRRSVVTDIALLAV